VARVVIDVDERSPESAAALVLHEMPPGATNNNPNLDK
jgi:hypothetical protein